MSANPQQLVLGLRLLMLHTPSDVHITWSGASDGSFHVDFLTTNERGYSDGIVLDLPPAVKDALTSLGWQAPAPDAIALTSWRLAPSMLLGRALPGALARAAAVVAKRTGDLPEAVAQIPGRAAGPG